MLEIQGDRQAKFPAYHLTEPFPFNARFPGDCVCYERSDFPFLTAFRTVQNLVSLGSGEFFQISDHLRQGRFAVSGFPPGLFYSYSYEFAYVYRFSLGGGTYVVVITLAGV